jgi:AAA+ ATPase superfamily predicted ATPase
MAETKSKDYRILRALCLTELALQELLKELDPVPEPRSEYLWLDEAQQVLGAIQYEAEKRFKGRVKAKEKHEAER